MFEDIYKNNSAVIKNDLDFMIKLVKLYGVNMAGCVVSCRLIKHTDTPICTLCSRCKNRRRARMCMEIYR